MTFVRKDLSGTDVYRLNQHPVLCVVCNECNAKVQCDIGKPIIYIGE